MRCSIREPKPFVYASHDGPVCFGISALVAGALFVLVVEIPGARPPTDSHRPTRACIFMSSRCLVCFHFFNLALQSIFSRLNWIAGPHIQSANGPINRSDGKL